MGAFVSFSLIFSEQTWAKTFSNVTTYCLLPLVGLVITTVISGNIALSLGMVGALSIIRFRHPVKSPLELSIYFLLLTLGITISSSVGKAIILLVFSMTVVFGYYFYKKRIRNNMGFLDLSFTEEQTQYLLEITCSKNSEYLSSNIFLLFSKENILDSTFTYKLSFINKYELDKVKNELNNLENIIEVKYSKI